MVDAIKAIHAGPALAWSFDAFRIVEDYRRISEERGVDVPEAYDDAHEKAARIEAAFASDPMPIRPCHNDLLEANFLLRDGHVWVVDHEYAGMGDPFFDLGNLSINNALSDDAQERLLASLLRGADGRSSRAPEADADHVRLPRGDVGRGAAGPVDARHRLRRVRHASFRSALDDDGGPALRRWLETAPGN